MSNDSMDNEAFNLFVSDDPKNRLLSEAVRKIKRETDLVNRIQSAIEYGNEYAFRSFKLFIVMEAKN